MEILSDTVFRGKVNFGKGVQFNYGAYIDQSEFEFLNGNFYSSNGNNPSINFQNLTLVYRRCSKIKVISNCSTCSSNYKGITYNPINLFGGLTEFGYGSFKLPQVDGSCTKFKVNVNQSGIYSSGNMRFYDNENSLIGYQVKNINTNEPVILKSVVLAPAKDPNDPISGQWTTEFIIEKSQGMVIPENTYKVTVFGVVEKQGVSVA